MKLNLAGCSRVLLINCALVLLSLWIGVALNRSFVSGPQQRLFSYTESEGKREFKPLTSEARAAVRFEEIQLEELRTVVAKREAVLLDGRSEKDYQNGHIPGAYSLSAADFDKRFREVSSRFSKDDRLVVYCGAGDCSLSRLLAERLSEKGYSQIRIYFGGYTQWFLGNNPVVKGKETP